jgi:hypothetical protein
VRGLKATDSSRSASRLLRQAVYVVLILSVALAVFVVFLRFSNIGVNGKATFEKVLSGTAYRPYVYRQLLPAAANLLAPYVDGMAALRLGRRSEVVLGERLFRAQLNGRLYPRQVTLILAMMYLSLLGFAAAMWLLLRDLGYSRRIQYLMPPAALLSTAIFFGYGYMYDFTVLFLFTLSLWLLHRKAWVPYLAVFALGTLNKETMLVLVLIYAVYYWNRLPRRTFLAIGAAQLGVFALIQSALRYRFRSNPGGALEWHLPDQIAAYQRLLSDSPWLIALGIAVLALVAALVIRGWKRKPAFIRCALSPLPFLAVLWLLWGYPFEIRNLMEALPVVLILMLPPPVVAAFAGDAQESSRPLTRQNER